MNDDPPALAALRARVDREIRDRRERLRDRQEVRHGDRSSPFLVRYASEIEADAVRRVRQGVARRAAEVRARRVLESARAEVAEVAEDEEAA